MWAAGGHDAAPEPARAKALIVSRTAPPAAIPGAGMTNLAIVSQSQSRSRARSSCSNSPYCETSSTSSKPSCSIRFSRRRASSGGQTSATSVAAASSAEFGPVGEIDGDVGQDRVVAAGLAIDLHAGFEIVPAAVSAGRGPALAFLGRIGDPARAAPGAHQDRRAAFAAGPQRQGSAIDRLAAPDLVHGLERNSHRPEAMVVIEAEQFEIRPSSIRCRRRGGAARRTRPGPTAPDGRARSGGATTAARPRCRARPARSPRRAPPIRPADRGWAARAPANPRPRSRGTRRPRCGGHNRRCGAIAGHAARCPRRSGSLC